MEQKNRLKISLTKIAVAFVENENEKRVEKKHS